MIKHHIRRIVRDGNILCTYVYKQGLITWSYVAKATVIFWLAFASEEKLPTLWALGGGFFSYWTNEHEAVGISDLFKLNPTGQLLCNLSESQQTFNPSSQNWPSTDIYIHSYQFYYLLVGPNSTLLQRRHVTSRYAFLSDSLSLTSLFFWLTMPYPYMACERPVGDLYRLIWPLRSNCHFQFYVC